MTAVTTILGLVGGSGSGKSTLAEWLVKAFPAGVAAVLCEDDYYFDLSDSSPLAVQPVNFDAPEAKDGALLRQHLHDLKSGCPIAAPRYAHATHRRLPETTLRAPRPLFILEGLHAPLLAPGLIDFTVFLDTPAEVRLARRLVRDVAERGRTAQSVRAEFAATVTPMHQRHVAPLRAQADLVLTPDPAGGDLAALGASICAALAARWPSNPHFGATAGARWDR